MERATELKDLVFSKAADEWLKDEGLYHPDKPKTIKSYGDCIKRVGMLLGDVVLGQIHIGHIREYQRLRVQHYHPRSINNDIRILARIMKKAGVWDGLREHFRCLPEPDWTPPPVLSDEEEVAFFEFASNDKAYSLAYWVASLTNNTSASGKELRYLQRHHVHMEATPPFFYIPEAKNEYRKRKIPLNDRGAIQMQRIMARAESIGSTKPEHFVFPLRTNRAKYEPTLPASESWLRKQWDKMVTAAMESCITCLKGKSACKCAKFRPILPFRLRPHNLRHQIITKLLEDGQPEEVVRAIAGHVSREMMEHYSHSRMEKKLEVLESLNGRRKKPSSVPVENRNGVRK